MKKNLIIEGLKDAVRHARAQADNAVDHPTHYVTEAGIEVIDIIERYGLGFHLGNTLKYLLRAGRKGDAETDLHKAAWYLERWLAGGGSDQGEMDGARGCSWATPEYIAAAFNLCPTRSKAVRRLLYAVIDGGDEMLSLHEKIDQALSATRQAIAEAESRHKPVAT